MRIELVKTVDGGHAMGIECDTPLGLNLTTLLFYQKISEEEYDAILSRVEHFSDGKECFIITKEDDQTIYITEKYKQ